MARWTPPDSGGAIGSGASYQSQSIRMGAKRRKSLIAATAKLREVGVVPWMTLVGWTAFCAGQEAAVVRQSGVTLREPAVWAGAAILWTIFAIPKKSDGMGGGRFSSLCILLFAVAAVPTMCLLAADQLAAGPSAGLVTLRSAMVFVMSLLPVAAALALPARPSGDRGSNALDVAILILSLGPAGVVLTAAWSPAAWSTVLAATGLSICASLLRMIAVRGETPMGVPPGN